MLTIAITGTSRGLGEDLASHYLSRGCRVIGFSRTEPARHLTDSAGYEHFFMDLREPESISDVASRVLKSHRNIDVLINNAGLYHPKHSLRMEISEIKDMVETNFFGTFVFTQLLAKRMITQETGGRIIFLGSISERRMDIGDSVYAGTKSAILGMMGSLSKELIRKKVTCNYLGISLYDSGMYNQFDPEYQRRVRESLPVQRVSDLSEIVAIINFFTAKETQYLTNQSLYLGGVR